METNRTFFTADWHLGESRLNLMERPFTNTHEMLELLIKRHNEVVLPNDEVIVVGDVCFKQAPEFLHYVEKFNGKKTLIRGNHDVVFTDEQLAPYFNKIVPEGSGIDMEYKGIPLWVTHYPTCGKPDRFNLVGHIHAAWKYQLNMLNIGVDVHHFYPTNLDMIPFYLEAIAKYYDEDVWVGYHDMNISYRGKRGKQGSYFKP